MGCQAARRTLAAMLVLTIGLLYAPPSTVLAVERGPSERPGSLTPNQLFGGQTLTVREALAACGPAAAVAFARAVGQPVSLDRAVAVARTVGWTPTYGMNGPYSQVALLQKLGVPVSIESGVSVPRLRQELQAGRPVIIRTSGPGVPGHYFVAERYDAPSGRIDLAQSALVLGAANGRRWFTVNEIASLGTGSPTHAIYLATRVPANTVVAASVKPATPIAARPGTGSVVFTGGPGARLRATPGVTGAIVGSVADGTRIAVSGASVVVAGRTWKQVTVAGGRQAWIDAGLLRAT